MSLGDKRHSHENVATMQQLAITIRADWYPGDTTNSL